MINRAFFFERIRGSLFGGKLTQSQVSGMADILDHWHELELKDDRWLAYMLATTFHETARTMQPIEEIGKGKGKPYGAMHPVTARYYYGRGLVQLTWYENYAKARDQLGEDLTHHPELALQMRIAVKILFRGMMEGWFSGKKLSDYFNSEKEDWVNARRIINGVDRAALVAGYAKEFYSALSHK